MTEPTAEQIAAEVERAHAITNAEDLCDWPSEDYHSSPCRAIATALARVRIDENEACQTIMRTAEDWKGALRQIEDRLRK